MLSKLRSKEYMRRWKIILPLLFGGIVALILLLFLQPSIQPLAERILYPGAVELGGENYEEWINAEFSAQGYRVVKVTLTNKTSRQLPVRLRMGRKLVNQNTSHQDLVFAKDLMATIEPRQTGIVEIPAYCISPNRSGPTADDRFVLDRMVSEAVLDVLRRSVQPEVIQQRIWMQIDQENRVERPSSSPLSAWRQYLEHNRDIAVLLAITLVALATVMALVLSPGQLPQLRGSRE